MNSNTPIGSPSLSRSSLDCGPNAHSSTLPLVYQLGGLEGYVEGLERAEECLERDRGKGLEEDKKVDSGRGIGERDREIPFDTPEGSVTESSYASLEDPNRVSLFTVGQFFEEAKPRARHSFNSDLRSTLSYLLPLVPLGWRFRTLGMTVPPRHRKNKEDQLPFLTRSLESLSALPALRQTTGFVFRHRGRKGGLNWHLILASPPNDGPSNEALGNWARSGRLRSGKKRSMRRYCVDLYIKLELDEHPWFQKRFWDQDKLTPLQKREALEMSLVYFLSGTHLARGIRRSKRVTKFHGEILDRVTRVNPFPVLLIKRRRFMFATGKNGSRMAEGATWFEKSTNGRIVELAKESGT